jgi:hypothetical protein
MHVQNVYSLILLPHQASQCEHIFLRQIGQFSAQMNESSSNEQQFVITAFDCTLKSRVATPLYELLNETNMTEHQTSFLRRSKNLVRLTQRFLTRGPCRGSRITKVLYHFFTSFTWIQRTKQGSL